MADNILGRIPSDLASQLRKLGYSTTADVERALGRGELQGKISESDLCELEQELGNSPA